jgi:succinoglycan biosynthesis transport protein ExoP
MDMNGTIDLGRLVRGVVRRWPVVLALALLGALSGYVISRLLPPVYEASTTVVVTTPKLKADFDSRFQSTLDLGLSTSLNRTFFSLIKNAELEGRVRNAMGDSLSPKEKEPGELLRLVMATQVGGDTSYFAIEVRHQDPDVAQRLADTWTRLYVAQIDEIYGFPVEAAQEIGASLAGAEAKLAAAEAALEDLQTETGMGLVDNVQYPASLSRSTGLTDARNLFGLYERYGASGQALEQKNLTLGSYVAGRDTLNLLIEEADALAGQSNATGQDLPLELLLSREVLVARGKLDTRELARQDIASVRQALQAEAQDLDELIGSLQADAVRLQAELADRARLLAGTVRERALAEESYIIHSLKRMELETQARLSNTWLQVVSEAQRPKDPVAPQKLLNAAVGGVLGLLIGVLAAVLLTNMATRRQGAGG